MSKRFYIDSNVFFYAKIADRRYGKACAKLLEEIHKERIEAVISTLVVLEVANALRKFGLVEEIHQTASAILSLPIETKPLTLAILQSALTISREYGLTPYDAVHAATMKLTNTKFIVSADKEFDKIPWIKRIDPLQYTI